MQTYVLLVFLMTDHGVAATTVPGYESQAACESAAQPLQRPIPRTLPVVTLPGVYFCLPGPTR
jgi:hypothetical protein